MGDKIRLRRLWRARKRKGGDIVTNEIAIRQVGMEEIGEQKPYSRYGMVINCPTCEIMIRSAHGFTRGE